MVKGMPYAGDFVNTDTNVLDDGTRITQTWVVCKEYRDSQGRTRREEVTPPVTKESLRIVKIDDPAAGVEYVLEPAKKIVHRFNLTASPTPRLSLGPRQVAAPESNVPESLVYEVTTKAEPLEPRVIQGMHADGVRVIQTLPENPAPGGHSGWVRVTDTWTATDLQAVVLEHVSMGHSETSSTMTNLRRGEQPSSLFEIPPDYRVEDELEDFVIEYPRPGRTSPPEVITRVGVKYTSQAGRAGIQGMVVLAATVDETGKARDVHVERSLEPGLDQEAVKAVSRWRFRPGREDGRAVRVDVKVEITFGLN
jgi:TonB family protein